MSGTRTTQGAADAASACPTPVPVEEWAREPDGRVRWSYDLAWGENGVCLYEDKDGRWHNSDPDEGGLPDGPLVPVEAMLSRHEKNDDGEWGWVFVDYVTIDAIPRNAYVCIPAGSGYGWIRHKSAKRTIATMWAEK